MRGYAQINIERMINVNRMKIRFLYERLKWVIFVCIPLLVSLTSCSEDDMDETMNDFPVLVAEDMTVLEGDDNNTIELVVTLDREPASNVIIRYSTRNGTAESGRDFVGISDASLVIQAGQTEGKIPITIIGNTFPQPNRHFDIVFTSVINATVENNAVRITIIDDDEEIIGSLNIPDEGYVSPISYPGYQMVWSDDFNGDRLNEEFWTHEIGTGSNGWGNNELQYYQPDNTYIHENEYLIIEAKQQSVSGSQYTSSRIITSDKASFKYGRIDIRAALPKTQGIWPALWMLGESFWSEGWPSCGEIDIMEMLGHQPNRVYGTAHWGPDFSQRQLKERSIFAEQGTDFHSRFHVFSIVWEEDRIEWFVDERSYNVLTPADMNGFDYPFNDEFFFIFNVAVGGNWPGSPDVSTVFPQFMVVDYIRVFQKE